jgi:AraC-like DNA-binding protein
VHPALRRFIFDVSQERLDVAPAPRPYRVLPGVGPVIGFQFRGRLSVLRNSAVQMLGRSGITGIQSTARWFLPDPETRSILVRLAPFGGYALLGQCMADVADQHVAMEQLAPGVRQVEDEIANLDPELAAERVQLWLFEMMQRRGRDPHPGLMQAVSRITAANGCERIENVSDAVGIGRRQLERLFRMQIGVAPKELASLARFTRAVERLGHNRSWAGLAVDAGYADQAHFIRSFKRRAGRTPAEFTRSGSLDEIPAPATAPGAGDVAFVQ